MSNQEEGPDPGVLSMLIPKTRDGDPLAREKLMLELHRYLEQVAAQNLEPNLRRKVGVSDVVQLSVLRILEGFEQFRGTNSQQLHAWIKQIVVNEVKSTRRSLHAEKRDIKRETQYDSTADPNRNFINGELTPSSETLRKERIERFHSLLSQMPADQAEVIRLRSIDQKSFAEIGEVMNRSESAASQLWYRAITSFERLLVSDGNFDEQSGDSTPANSDRT